MQKAPVSLITTLASEHAYPLNDNTRCIIVPPVQGKNLDNCPWDIQHLRQAIEMERNSIVLSFMKKSNIPCILATSGLPVYLIIAERADPRMQTLYTDYKRALMQRFYPMADALVVQTQSVKQNWALRFMVPDKVHVIPNMGRMTASKGIAGFINQLPRIFAKHPEQSFVLLGEGPDRPSLEAQGQPWD